MMSDAGLIAQRDENMKNFLHPLSTFAAHCKNTCCNGLQSLSFCLSWPLLSFNLASEKEFEERTLCSGEC